MQSFGIIDDKMVEAWRRFSHTMAYGMLLRGTPDSVSAIASALGFLDVSYFVKLLKRFEGVTPLTYRKLKRSSSAAPP